MSSFGAFISTLYYFSLMHTDKCRDLNINISKIREEKEIIKLSRTLQLSVTTKFRLSVHYQEAVCVLANLQFCLKENVL